MKKTCNHDEFPALCFPFFLVSLQFFFSLTSSTTQSEESHQLNYQRLQSVAHNNNRTILTDNQIQRVREREKATQLTVLIA